MMKQPHRCQSTSGCCALAVGTTFVAALLLFARNVAHRRVARRSRSSMMTNSMRLLAFSKRRIFPFCALTRPPVIGDWARSTAVTRTGRRFGSVNRMPKGYSHFWTMPVWRLRCQSSIGRSRIVHLVTDRSTPKVTKVARNVARPSSGSISTSCLATRDDSASPRLIHLRHDGGRWQYIPPAGSCRD